MAKPGDDKMNRCEYRSKVPIPAIAKHLEEWKRMVKWEEDSIAMTQVDLRVEENGFFVHYVAGEEGNVIDIAQIVDIRTDRAPKDPKVIELFKTMCDGDENIQERCFTIVTAESFTVQRFDNFFVNTKNDCPRFVNDLFALTHHFINTNLSQMDFVRKTYTRLKCSTKVDKHISIKEIVRAIAKDEKKKVMEALRSAGLKPQDKKNDTIEKSKFTFEAFYKFYNVLLGTRTDIEKVFGEIKESKRNYLTLDQMVEFLNKFQRDPRLNEILFPFHSPDGTKKLIKTYEKDKNKSKIGQFTLEGFHNYLMSADCLPTNILNLGLYQSMNEPLSHYFINSSHNTYLTGDQFGSKSSVEMYRQSLLAGCRCVELDCWDGEDNEPHITHGFTLCSNIHFKDVIIAINETAFKTSPYPVILSFENHCTPRQQQKMAHYCIDIFGDKLLKEPLDDPKAQLKKGCMLPSPEMLKYKILIKNKKRKDDMPDQQDKEDEKKEEETALSGTDAERNTPRSSNSIYLDGVEPPQEACEDEAKAGSWEEREEDAEASLSKLVNYIMPALKFRGFEAAAEKGVSYEMSSFVETTALNHLKEKPVEFVSYNKRQLSRIYPKGARVASDNYQPQMFWNTGCQMVALNYQTLDLPMQLNIGKFEFNSKTGYLLKPDFMTKPAATFNPFVESTVEGVVAAELKVSIISGQFLTERKCGLKVELEMYGVAKDSVRRKFQTKTITNSVNPQWNEEPFVFSKIVIPDLAMMRFIVNDDAGKMVGQRIIPMECIQSGYRYISLRNEFNQPYGMASIFVKIEVRDYIPSDMADFANALVDPIAHMSKDEVMSMRSDALKTLVDDDDLVDDAKAKEAAEAKPTGGGPATTTNNRRNRRVKGRTNPDAAGPPPPAPAPPKQAAIVLNNLDSFTNTMPKVGQTPQDLIKKEQFVGGLYVGDDRADLVTDEKANQKKKITTHWDVKAEEIPDVEERLQPQIAGIDWADITEEAVKKTKLWVKFYAKQEKRETDLVKKHAKEKTLLEKTQQTAMEKMIKDNTVQRQNAIKQQEKSRKGSKKKSKSSESDGQSQTFDSQEEFDKYMKKFDDKQAKEVANLEKQQKSQSLKIEKIHKREQLELQRKLLKENHDEYKKQKNEIQAQQLAQFEAHQLAEQNDIKIGIDKIKAESMAKYSAEIKDKTELEAKRKEVDEKADKKLEGDVARLKRNQEIRREQVVAEHKEQIKLADSIYLKRLKELDENTQAEVERLEAEIQEIGYIES